MANNKIWKVKSGSIEVYHIARTGEEAIRKADDLFPNADITVENSTVEEASLDDVPLVRVEFSLGYTVPNIPELLDYAAEMIEEDIVHLAENREIQCDIDWDETADTFDVPDHIIEHFELRADDLGEETKEEE